MASAERKRPPPVKVLSGQLRAAEGRGAADSGDGWTLRLSGGRSLPVSLVWMQGTVLEVQPERSTAMLLDETGTFAVLGVNNIPRGKPCLAQENKELHQFKWTEGWRLLDVEVMQQGQRGAVSVSLVKLFLSARLQGCSYEQKY
ncbi:recQ-mediated genome instability protein 2 isoform X2 [Pseudoliparis swirei]|uniref:recQ-mediated genome instability protein 2 isoform X2 n=1 Tax=Pseudoliparis swirei TaxID=2059687 RepID=UPI0024BE11A1|nr:recQ-mediated genome instability protein 2 isoform X2 [Pseudoliparis swirei]